jgi:hypothetical protein
MPNFNESSAALSTHGLAELAHAQANAAPARAYPRRLGHVGQPGGPCLICTGGMHGNEPSGVWALERVFAKLQSDGTGLRGEIYGFVGNIEALRQKKRYLKNDLNRHWTRGRVKRLRNETQPLSYEDAELVALDREIAEVLKKARGKVYAIDLHSTSGEGPAFCILEDTLPNRRFALRQPVTLVIGIEEEILGTISHFLSDQGVVVCGFEAGQHDDPYSVDRAEAAVWIALEASGVIASGSRQELAWARDLLQTQTGRLPHFTEVRYRHAIKPADEFRMKPGFRNFDPVAHDQPLARDVKGVVVSPLTGYLLMPLYQPQGDDGFFLVTRVHPFWLWLSAVFRRCHIERVVHLLPGVSRHPELEDSYLVDTRVARFLALRVFHLLGYRRIGPISDVLTMAHRYHDLA